MPHPLDLIGLMYFYHKNERYRETVEHPANVCDEASKELRDDKEAFGRLHTSTGRVGDIYSIEFNSFCKNRRKREKKRSKPFSFFIL